MRVKFKDEDLVLRTLGDQEYMQAMKLARMSGVPLDVCPTCGGREEEIPDSGGVKSFIGRSYKFRGVEHECECQAQIALRARYLVANIGEQYMCLDWNDFDGSSEAREMVNTYLAHWQSFKKHGWGLEFGGPLGVGKTFAATHIGKELIKCGQMVYFVPFVEMVSAFEKEDSEKIERRMRETTFLVLDELLPSKSERQRDFYATRLEALIRHRTNHNLPTIITTNLKPGELHEHYPRTYSLLAAKQERVEMTGDDVRPGRISIENIELIINDEVRPIT